MLQAGGGQKGNPRLLYHLCLTPSDVDLKGAAALTYGNLIQGETQNKPDALWGDVDPLHMFDEKRCAGDNVSRTTTSVEMTREGEAASAMAVRPYYSIDASIRKDWDGKRAYHVL